MTTEELIFRHAEVAYSNKYKDIPLQHVKLSIQFAISMLEESITDTSYHEVDSFCRDKIQEIKQYFDEGI